MTEGEGASFNSGFALDNVFARLEGVGGEEESSGERFLATRLEAARMAFACFSSGKIDWIFGREVLERREGVARSAAWRDLILEIAVARGILASWARKVRRDWISACVDMLFGTTQWVVVSSMYDFSRYMDMRRLLRKAAVQGSSD